MARLKKDHTGWHSASLWKKYKQPSINDQPPKPKRKKDTRKWCKGKVGVEHSFVRIERHKISIFVWSIDRCVNCGKKRFSTQ